MSNHTALTPKRIVSYVFVISMLLLGSVLCAWWVLGKQINSQLGASPGLYVSPGLSDLAPAETSFENITSEDIVNKTIGEADIADGSITLRNLDPSVRQLVETGEPAALELPLDDILAELEKRLGLPLSDITSLDILDGTISLDDLETSIINTLSLAGTVLDDSITSAKIVDGAIGTGDMAIGSIDSTLLADGAVGTLQLAAGVVNSAKILDGAIGGVDIAASAVTSVIADGAVDTVDIAVGAITGIQLADGSVASANIVDGTIESSDITTDAITSALIADGGVSGNDIATGTIISANILDGTIGALDIASGAITGTLIADGTIATGDIAANAITSGLIADGVVSGSDIAASTITNANILDGTIGTNDISSGAITSTLIADGTIAGGDIASGAVGATQLASNAVDATKLSTAAKKRTLSVPIGDIAVIVGDTERPAFIAPTNGTITKVTFTNALNITAAANKGVLSLERKTASTATVASVDLASVSLTGFIPQSPTLSSGTSFSTGDVYSFKWDAGLVGVALTGFLVTIEYVPSE